MSTTSNTYGAKLVNFMLNKEKGEGVDFVEQVSQILVLVI